VRLRFPYASEQFDERKIVIDVACRLSKRASGITCQRETGPDDGNAGYSRACRRQRYGAAQGKPPHNEKSGCEYSGDDHIGEKRMPKLLAATRRSSLMRST
jgi:hypothetical protein